MRHDVIIIGAGPAGLSLARALCSLSLKVALVERQPESAIAQPAFDGREIALTHASMRLMRELGLWEHLPAEDISPLRAARVMNGASTHAMEVDGGLQGHDALGTLVPNHRIREAAWRAVEGMPTLERFFDARIEAVHTDTSAAHVRLQDGTQLQASLLVAADSRFSETRRALGISADQHDFGKTMIVCRMRHDRSNEATAWEWFDHGQTLALLPLQDHLSSTVLTVPGNEARQLMSMSPEDFAREMQRRYDGRLGDMQLESERHAYPLVAVYARRFVAQRFALAGDAAVGMHPVTAHGFNLGLASIERLRDLARTAQAEQRDLGDARLLARYQRRHRAGTWPLYTGTRAVVEIFTSERPALRPIREGILRIGQRVLPFRRALASHLVDEAPLDAPLARRVIASLSNLRPS